MKAEEDILIVISVPPPEVAPNDWEVKVKISSSWYPYVHSVTVILCTELSPDILTDAETKSRAPYTGSILPVDTICNIEVSTPGTENPGWIEDDKALSSLDNLNKLPLSKRAFTLVDKGFSVNKLFIVAP